MAKKIQLVAAALFLCVCAFGQPNSRILQGAWVASAGPDVFHGKWSARVSPQRPNLASGSWVLLNDSNDIVLQGTWSAHKSASGWKGTWSARVLHGRAYSGSWSATDPGRARKTLIEMLETATKGTASGGWLSGRLAGEWRLNPAP